MIKMLIFCTALLVGSAFQSVVAQTYPPGLSNAAIGKFDEYETRIVAALRESKSAIEARDMPTEFPKDYAIGIWTDVFGEDWSAVEAYATAALKALPYKDESARVASPPVERFDMGEDAQRILSSDLSEFPEFELGMATNRMWDPENVARGASMMVIGRTSPEEVAHHSVSGAYISTHLARTTWKGGDAMAYYNGSWVFLISYARTQRGLIMMTDMAMYRR